MKITPIQVRIAFYVLVASAALLASFLWLKTRDANRDLAANAAQGVRTDRAASGIARDASEAVIAQRSREAAVAEVRITYQHQYEEVRRNDPSVRAWSDTPVPDRLRQLARERREARERLGCVGDGCGGDGAAERTRR